MLNNIQTTSWILDLETVKTLKPNLDLLKIIPEKVAEKIQTVIFDNEWKKLFLLTTNASPDLISQVTDKLISNWYKLQFFYCDLESFHIWLSWYQQIKTLEEKSRNELEARHNALWKTAQEMIQKLISEKEKYSEWEFITELIRLSFASWASDLHFQPEEKWVNMRIRIDWVLQLLHTFAHQDFVKYLIKLKFMAWVRLNVDYLPQDGRFDFDTYRDWKAIKIDVRVNFMPWLRWESIVMRFLDWNKWIVSFSKIGFQDSTLEILQKNIKQNYGMILITWPTGSWKTTTLYSILNTLNEPWKKIITLEDPVEYELPGIQQSQINDKKWYSYEQWLKAILRQDPNVIMVWEIRTLETATIAINAALTWHLVLSTLHTNTAIEAINRLLNMWVEPFMLAPALNLIIGQRLLRKLDDCKTFKPANPAESQEIKSSIQKINDLGRNKLTFDWNIPQPVGCEKCWMVWYAWRIAAIETFEVSDDIKDAILKGKSPLEIYSIARQNWYLTMKEDAYIKMLQWTTTLDEIRRVL